MEDKIKKLMIKVLCVCMMVTVLPINTYSLYAQEIEQSIVDCCVESGDFFLDSNGKLALTSQGKKESTKLSQSLSKVKNNNKKESSPISPYIYTDPDYGVGIVYKNETKVISKFPTEYVYMAHKKAVSHLTEMNSYKRAFGGSAMTSKVAESLLKYMFGDIGLSSLDPMFKALAGIVLLFASVSAFLYYYCNIVNKTIQSAKSTEGIIIIWWGSLKIIEGKTQGF